MTGAPSRTQALEDISAWCNADVVALLRKNGVDESCCKAVQKRQIDGDELLHLTEGKLALWKSDLTRPLIWSLWTFVEEVRKCPERFVAEKQAQQREEEAAAAAEEELLRQRPAEVEFSLSDTSPWDTDFEDSVDDPSDEAAYMAPTHTGQPLAHNEPKGRRRPEAAMLAESTYANCEAMSATDESTYANVGLAEPEPAAPPTKNNSRLHSIADPQNRKSLAEQLTEQLILMGVKPTPAPKPLLPEALLKRKPEMPPFSFLHTRARVRASTDQQKNENVPTTESTFEKDVKPLNGQRSRESAEKNLRKLPKAPDSIRGFDLVANLPPTRQPDESDEEESYEVFDEQIVEQHKRNSLVNSGTNTKRNSVESIFQPPNSVEQEEDYEIYESITESPDENGQYYKNESSIKRPAKPPPLPAKPPPIIGNLNHYIKEERSPDKKSATLPHAGSNASLNNAARPLPPPPDRKSYHDKPWFHNLTREQANHLIEQGTYGTTNDGYFLMRPSTTNPNNPLILVLWCRDRVYNVPVRRRPDNRYALGTAKNDEHSFESIDDIIPYYKREKLILYTGGVQSGSTKLTDTPPK